MTTTSGARGTDRSSPLFYVQVQSEGGTATFVDLTDRVLSLEYQDSEKKADLLKLQVNNWDLSNFDDPIWKAGNIILASWGYAGNMAPPRECVIQKVTGAQVLTIEAQSKAVLMNKEVKSRTFDGVRRSDVVAVIAKEHGYSGPLADIEDTQNVIATITQAGLTDAQFLKRLADAEGFEFYVDFDGLHWHPRRMGQKPLRVLQWFLPPDVGDIVAFNIENDIFAKPGQVTSKGRDPLEKKDIQGVGSDSTTAREAAAPTSEIIDPRTGEATLDTNAASATTMPTSETSSAQAKREADGVYRRTQQTTVKLSISMVGDPGIVAKSVIDVRGLGRRLSGLYYVNEATHKIDPSGYQLGLKTSTDGTNGHQELIMGQLAATKAQAVASKKRINDKTDEAADPGALEAIETVDPQTGSITISYQDSRGRSQ